MTRNDQLTPGAEDSIFAQSTVEDVEKTHDEETIDSPRLLKIWLITPGKRLTWNLKIDLWKTIFLY